MGNKDGLIIECPHCHGKMRVPANKAKIKVYCPHCRQNFYYQTPCFKSSNQNHNTRKVWIFIVILILLIAVGIHSCNKSERNKIGSSIDWGDNYYWNSQSESVEKIPWK